MNYITSHYITVHLSTSHNNAKVFTCRTRARAVCMQDKLHWKIIEAERCHTPTVGDEKNGVTEKLKNKNMPGSSPRVPIALTNITNYCIAIHRIRYVMYTI